MNMPSPPGPGKVLLIEDATLGHRTLLGRVWESPTCLGFYYCSATEFLSNGKVTETVTARPIKWGVTLPDGSPTVGGFFANVGFGRRPVYRVGIADAADLDRSQTEEARQSASCMDPPLATRTGPA